MPFAVMPPAEQRPGARVGRRGPGGRAR
jgi:hypothetical protein